MICFVEVTVECDECGDGDNFELGGLDKFQLDRALEASGWEYKQVSRGPSWSVRRVWRLRRTKRRKRRTGNEDPRFPRGIPPLWQLDLHGRTQLGGLPALPTKGG
jgi:hypothetical protein